MKSKSNIFWGIFFILAAALVILNQLGFLVGVGVFELIITLLLIPVIVKSAIHLHFGGVLIPLAIIGILYSQALGIEKFVPWPLLAVAVLLSIGLNFIFPHHHSPSHYNFAQGTSDSNHGYHDPEDAKAQISEENDSIVNIDAHFAGVVKYINSQNLEKVNVYSSFAGTKIYFDNAKLAGDSVNVNIDSSFGGIEMYVPKTWRLKNNIDCTMGGVDEKGIKNTEVSKTLVLTGYIRFSGVTIIYI